MNRVSETRQSAPSQALAPLSPPSQPSAPSPAPRPEPAESAFTGATPRPAYERLTPAAGEHLGNARGCDLGFEIVGPRPIEHRVVEQAQPCGAPIKDLQTATSTIRFDEEGPISRLKLNLDVAHAWRGDLVVQLTSPSGKTVDISNRAGGGGRDLKGDFDLSSAFWGQPLKGEWTLTVRDASQCDEGTLNGWSLSAAVK